MPYLRNAFYGFALLAFCLLAKAKDHEHGAATVGLTVTGKSAKVSFTSDADSLYGFEHEPQRPQEKAKRDIVQKLLKDGGAGIFIFDQKLHCKLQNTGFKEIPESKGHLEVQAHYEVTCAQNLKGTWLNINTSSFSRLRQIHLQMTVDKSPLNKDLMPPASVLLDVP